MTKPILDEILMKANISLIKYTKALEVFIKGSVIPPKKQPHE